MAAAYLESATTIFALEILSEIAAEENLDLRIES